MMKAHSWLFMVLAMVVAVTPLLSTHSAHAVSRVSVSADTTEPGRQAKYTIMFTLEDDFSSGDKIYLKFDSGFELGKEIMGRDIRVEGKEPKKVTVNRNRLEITVNERFRSGDAIEVDIRNRITNPEEEGSYEISVETSKDDEAGSDSIRITKKGDERNNNFSVSLSDSAAGARSSYSFSVKLGNKKLSPGSEVRVQFPSADMLPGILSPSAITLNGVPVRSAFASGRTVTLEASDSITASHEVRVTFENEAWITNPKAPGNYAISVTAGGTTATSRPFTIVGSTVPPATGTPATVNNSTATVTLSSTALNAATGIQIGIKGLGMPLATSKDFIEVVIPAGFRVPVYIAPNHVTVNGLTANYVSVRGQNVLVYPAQDLPANTPVLVVIGQAANIITPATQNTYTISIYTSEEKGLLFARPVAVGGAVAPETPATPGTPPAATVPAHAARLKINVANFTKGGKTYPMLAAPFLANGSTTMVPAQFFKDGLALSTQWNKGSVVIVSGNKVLRFTVGSNKALVGNTSVSIPAAVTLKNNMPMVPVKFISDQLGYKVVWEAATSSIAIYK